MRSSTVQVYRYSHTFYKIQILVKTNNSWRVTISYTSTDHSTHGRFRRRKSIFSYQLGGCTVMNTGIVVDVIK